jgi:hypothetical protein
MTKGFIGLSTACFLVALVLPNYAHAEWTRFDEDGQGMVLYIDQATFRQEKDGVRIWSLFDYDKAKTVANTHFKSTKALNQFDCPGERMRILSMSFHSGNMGLGQTVHSDSTLQPWEPVSPSSIGSSAFDHACSIFAADGKKHKYGQDEIPGWKQGPSSKQADSFYDPRYIERNRDKVKMWVILNLKEPLQVQGRLHWSSRSRIEYNCKEESSRVDGGYYYALPYAKGKTSGAESAKNDWYPIGSRGIERGLLDAACEAKPKRTVNK